MMLIDEQLSWTTSTFYETKAFIRAAFYEHHSCIFDFIRVVSRIGLMKQNRCHASQRTLVLNSTFESLSMTTNVFKAFLLPSIVYSWGVLFSFRGKQIYLLWIVETFARGSEPLEVWSRLDLTRNRYNLPHKKGAPIVSSRLCAGGGLF